MDHIIETALSKIRNTPDVRNIVGLKIHAKDGSLVLTGRASSYYLKQLAQETIKKIVPPGSRLMNHIIVSKEERTQAEDNPKVQGSTDKALTVETSMENNGKQRALEFIDPTKIRLNDDKMDNSIFRNARTTLKREEMATNRESIRKLGLLKPLIVRPLTIKDPDGYLYQLVCGSRRLRNILRLREQAEDIIREGRPFKPEELCYCPETAEWLPATEVYATVKTFVRECDDETAIAINIAENLEHSKLPEIDLMEFCQELVELKKDDNTPRYTRAKIADMCNRSESWVSLTLELNQLPEKVRQMMYDDRVTRTAALAFLQTRREKIDEVIEVGENIVRQEKMTEAAAAEEEMRIAQIDLEDAQNDVLIHEMMQNDGLRQMAEKREGVARKRVSSASEKRDQALKEADSPKLTADVINKANLLVPEAKKGKPKAMPVKDIRTLYTKFTEFRTKQSDIDSTSEIVYGTVNALLETILGHRACPANIEELIWAERKNVEKEVFLDGPLANGVVHYDEEEEEVLNN